jgi:hypothetical protein
MFILTFVGGSAARRNEPESWQEVLKQLAGIGKAKDEANKRADEQRPRKRAMENRHLSNEDRR